MCGIVACLSNYNNNVPQLLINGLKKLQNRGYDSCGISIIDNNNLITDKYANIDAQSMDKLCKSNIKNMRTNIGIGHTRWATHGEISHLNSHPHIDYTGELSIVHNGIIENYDELKKKLIKNGIQFKSQTDTEVIINYISYLIHVNDYDIMSAIRDTIGIMRGSWAFVILDINNPNKLFIAKKDSPLLLGFDNKNMFYISSEKDAFPKNITKYMSVDDDAYMCIDFDLKLDFNKIYEINVNNNNENDTPLPYKYWLEKEIFEQNITLNKTNKYGNLYEIPKIDQFKKKFRKFEDIIILGCGTSYHAGLVGSHFFKNMGIFNTVQVINASEFTLKDVPYNVSKTCIFVISQSGETKDVYDAVKLLKNKKYFIVGIINKIDSLIARSVDCSLYLHIGREVSVASTKSFTSQVLMFCLIMYWYRCIFTNISNPKLQKIEENISIISSQVNKLLSNIREQCDPICDIISDKKSMFILGRNIYTAISNEAALKIKEVAYIFASGFLGGELKHGSFALIEKGMPIFMLIMDDIYYSKMCSTAEEIKTRGGYIIIITDISIKDKKYQYMMNNFENIINIPHNSSLSPILSVIPFQYIAYKIGKINQYSIDYPRNLAKCVTTD